MQWGEAELAAVGRIGYSRAVHLCINAFGYTLVKFAHLELLLLLCCLNFLQLGFDSFAKTGQQGS